MGALKRLAIVAALIGVAAGVYLGMYRRLVHPAVQITRSNPDTAIAPRLQTVDLNGHSIDTATYSGKVVLINFWAAWCTPCAEEVPQFVSLQNKYGAEGLQTVGISMEDKETALRDFYRKYKMNYPVVIGNQVVAQEYGGILGLPTTLVVGRDGRIRSKYAGLADFPKLEQEIVALLHSGK